MMRIGAFGLAVLCCGGPVWAQSAASDRERALLDRIDMLEKRIAALERRLPAPAEAAPTGATASVAPAAPADRSATGDSSSLPGFAAGTTINVLLDGHYEYDFNRPAGRVALLRPFDAVQNNFTLSQGVVAIERAPDPSQGRRFGARLDLMFGAATEELGGNPANEPRTGPYRNLYQAYGTYVFPVGKGLTVDFGRFASPIGFEGVFVKDQINYTRSLLYTALPFYHMGFRTSYKIGSSTTAQWMLVNGVNQTEDFNGFKSNHFLLSTALSKTVNWTGSYYVGREGRDGPRPDGRTHIADTYLTWTATPKLTLVGEGDWMVSRAFATDAPSRLAGGAGYVKYQFVPAFSLAGRFEYVSDRGGLLSGATQALKEGTITAAYQPVGGFQVRWEYRRDWSNQRFFPTETPGRLRQDQNTALVGLLFWFGGKQGSW